MSMSTASSSSGRSGDAGTSAGWTLTGRRFANSPRPPRMAKSACSGRTIAVGSSHFGPPTAPRRIASLSAQAARSSARIGAPYASIPAPPTTRSFQAIWKPNRAPAAAKRVLAAAGARFGFQIAWNDLVVGGAGIDAYGAPIRAEDLAACAESDAILLGAVGGPKWDDPTATVRPEQALFAMRGGLGLFANLRPVSVHPALVPASPLRPELLDGVDMLIVRELTGGLYFGARSEASGPAGARAAHDLLPYSEPEIARVARLAFELARGRRKRLTSVDKANVLATSRLWRTVVHEIATEYPDVALED